MKIEEMIKKHIHAWNNIKAEYIRLGRTNYDCVLARVDTLEILLNEVLIALEADSVKSKNLQKEG